MLNYKLQLGCFIIILYVAFTYYSECRKIQKQHKYILFDFLLIVGLIYYVLDILTVYMVNHLQTVNPTVNMVCHALFLGSIDLLVFLMFYYILDITDCIPRKHTYSPFLPWIPFIINEVVVFANMGSLEYRTGKVTNYSMGVSAYTCYIMVGVYFLLTAIVFLRRWRYFEAHKRNSIGVYMVISMGVMVYQMVFPESLVSSLAVTIIILCIYINMQNPAKMELDQMQAELVYGFANVIESRDGSTGAHVKRSTRYVELIVKELRKKDSYKQILTSDYINQVLQAAPMHDIGKIAVPDAILQKPGKLTEEEYAQIQLHTIKGAELIQSALGNMGNQEYLNVAREVVLYHHERWDGKGYPEGLEGEKIPLHARIMAVADVFDAVSENRCYRAAMSLDKSFDIIREGIGTAFDPVIAETFLDAREKVEQIHHSF